jgi:hypothetical protein
MKTLGEIASYVGGQIFGDPSVPIERVVHPAVAQGDSDLALILSPSAASFLEVLQLCSHAVIGWLDAPSGLFGLRSIQMASV